MGGTSGKIKFKESDSKHKTKATVDDEQIASSRQQKTPLANGDANAVNDIPSIDDEQEEQKDHTEVDTAASPTTDTNQTHEVNGTVQSAHEAEKRKSPNRKWSQRAGDFFRNKSRSGKGKHSEEEHERPASPAIASPASADVPGSTAEPEEAKVVASTLVDDVIAEAVAQEEEPTPPSDLQEPSQPAPQSSTEQPDSPKHEVSPQEETAPEEAVPSQEKTPEWASTPEEPAVSPISTAPAECEAARVEVQEATERASTPEVQEPLSSPIPAPVESEAAPEEVGEISQIPELTTEPVEDAHTPEVPPPTLPDVQEPTEPEGKSNCHEDAQDSSSHDEEQQLDVTEAPFDTNNTNAAEATSPAEQVEENLSPKHKIIEQQSAHNTNGLHVNGD